VSTDILNHAKKKTRNNFIAAEYGLFEIKVRVGVCSGITGSDSEHAIIREKQRALNKVVFLTLILTIKNSFR